MNLWHPVIMLAGIILGSLWVWRHLDDFTVIRNAYWFLYQCVACGRTVEKGIGDGARCDSCLLGRMEVPV